MTLPTQPLSDEALREKLRTFTYNKNQGIRLTDEHVDYIMALIRQDREARTVEAYKHGLVTGAMPEAIGKPIAEDYIARLTHKQKEK